MALKRTKEKPWCVQFVSIHGGSIERRWFSSKKEAEAFKKRAEAQRAKVLAWAMAPVQIAKL